MQRRAPSAHIVKIHDAMIVTQSYARGHGWHNPARPRTAWRNDVYLFLRIGVVGCRHETSPWRGNRICRARIEIPSPSMGEGREGEAALRCETVVARFPHLDPPPCCWGRRKAPEREAAAILCETIFARFSAIALSNRRPWKTVTPLRAIADATVEPFQSLRPQSIMAMWSRRVLDRTISDSQVASKPHDSQGLLSLSDVTLTRSRSSKGYQKRRYCPGSCDPDHTQHVHVMVE